MRMSELVERKRESDLNAVGPLKMAESSLTSQTGLARADRNKFELVICRGSLS